MTGEIVIIAPEIGTGGVGDYTRRLLENLPGGVDLRLIIPSRGTRPVSSFEHYRVDETDGSVRDLCGRLPTQGKVLVQYSAYGFDRHGYPRKLIKALLNWKKTSSGVLAIMFHEIWGFWPIWNKNRAMQQLHRRHLRRLLRVTDAVFTSTTSQAAHLAALSPRCEVQVLPVGSNIPRAREIEEKREKGLAVLFGLQPSRLRTLGKMYRGLKELGAAGKIRKIVTVGGGRSRSGDDDEAALLTRLDLTEGFEQRGALPEEKISELLLAGEFGISAQDDLSITKSSTFMAHASHGMNIISDYAASKPEPLSWLTTPEELLGGIKQVELETRSEKLREWQERTASWPVIGEKVARALEL